MDPMTANDSTSTRHQYRTVSGYQMDDRKLLLRGGIYDGRSWTGVIAVGKRVFCGGDDAWSLGGDDGLHLHGLEPEELLADGDGVAHGDVDRHDRPLHRRFHSRQLIEKCW